jgi:hypothetical protein
MKRFNIDWDLITGLAISLSLPIAILFGAIFPSLFYSYN